MELGRAAEALLRSRLIPPVTSKVSLSSQCQRLRRGIIAAQEPQFRRKLSSSPNYFTPEDSAIRPTEQATKDNNGIPLASDVSQDWLYGTLKQNRLKPGERNKTMSYFSDPKYQSKIFPNQGNSASDLFAALVRPENGPKSKEFDFTRMAQPPSSSPIQLMEGLRNQELKIPTAARQLQRLTPQIGRTVTLGTGVDLSRGIRLLEQSCKRNSVKADFNKQRFHERPGLKRKRLKSQRWRKNFMTAFKATVNRVKRLRAQGW